MGRTRSSRENTHRDSDKSSAARTRPISLEEIMSRRKKKLAGNDDEQVSEIRESAEKDNHNGVLSDRGLERKKDVKVTVDGNSKRLEEAVAKKERGHSESREKGDCDSEAKTKLKSYYSKSSKEKESKKEKQNHHRSRASDHTGPELEKESEKKWAKIPVDKDKHDKDRKSGKEEHIKHGSRVDDKNRSVVDGHIPKKHDTGKRDTERKDRKEEHSKTHHEEPRAKRRRSRSREYDRERDRSKSMSPRLNKRSYHGRDYDEPVYESSKEKSSRKYSDADSKYRKSDHGGYNSRHSRNQGSGLGGYSPRKRKTEAAVKIPSPRKRSPETKTSSWDQPPAGISHGGSGQFLNNFQSLAGKTLESLSSTEVLQTDRKPQPVPSLNVMSMPINVSIDSVQLTQATRPRRRLYVENLPSNTSEKSVIDYFNDFLLSSGVNHVQGANPCISCIINKEKCQAVVEFLTPEDATSAISLDGRSFSESVLKIRRPKDFVEAAPGGPGPSEKTVPTIKAISDVVRDSPHKIFIGGISKNLSPDMILAIVGAFGPLRGYRFGFNKELDGPCAFVEYEDNSITQKACAGLNGMKLGGQVITVVQAFFDSHGEEDAAENLPSYDIPPHAKSLLVDATQVLKLNNVFDPVDLLSLPDSELEEILEDIRLECMRFGAVKSINVVRADNKREGSTEFPEQQEPHAEFANINPSSNNYMNGDADIPSLSNVKEIQAVNVEMKTATSIDEKPMEDHEMRDSANPGPAKGSASQLEEPTRLDREEDNSAEENLGLEAGSVSELPLQQGVEITDGQNTTLEANKTNGVNKEIPVEATSSNNIVASDEGDVGNGDHSSWGHNLDVFEPGCVMVEFLRKEAACAAAHCLHQRCYGERVVLASYVPHELYITRFPR